MTANSSQIVGQVWVESGLITVICVLFCQLSRKFYWLAAPLCIYYLLRGWIALGAIDPAQIGSVPSGGLSYLLQTMIAEALPLAVILALGTMDHRRRRRTH